MKTKILMLSMMISSSFGQLAMAQADEHFTSQSAVRNLTDDGDAALAGQYQSSASTASSGHGSYARKSANSTQLTSYNQYDPDMSVIAPTVVQDYSGGYEDYSGYCGSGCGNCSGGCGSCCGGCQSPSRFWLTAETLLFFAADRRSPNLVMTADNEVNPLAGQVTYGGVLSSDVLPGYRASVGAYLDPCQRIGVGARAYGIYDDTDRYSVSSSDGTTSIGVPFYNPNRTPDPGNDAFIVAGNGPGNDPISQGGVNSGESLSMVGAEGSGYILLSRGPCYRFDMVAGYTYNQLRNAVFQNFTSTTLLDGDGIVNGTVFQFQDRFATDNRFSGAHLGVLSNVVRKRVSLSTLAKISFGEMRSRTNIIGNGVTTVPGADPNDPPDVTGGPGFFARTGNVGSYTNQSFAFMPELGIKLGYCIRPNMQVSVGYTLLMWSSVAMAGDQMDRIVSLTGSTQNPERLNNSSTFWMQSIDLGLGWSY